MATKVFNMEGGLHSAAAYSAFENRAYGSCVASTDSFVVTAGTGMNARISAGDGLIDTGLNFGRRIQSDAQETVSVEPASTSFNRIDSVVAYIDTAVTPTTSVVDNTNGVLKFASIAGTAASSPQAPSQAAIQSAIGAGNPFMRLANITVPVNATNLTGATFDNIAPTPLLKHYPINSIYISVSNVNPQTLFGGKWQAFAPGRTLVGFNAAETEFNQAEKTGGAKTHTLTDDEMPATRVKAHSTQHAWRPTGSAYNVSSLGSGSLYMLISNSETHDNELTIAGGGNAHNNLQPFITVYMWKRIA